MLNEEILANILLMFLCYIYIILIIFISSKMGKGLHVSQKASRKFLHAMIGNLPFIIPFFTANIYPTLVAAPFTAITFLASPYSPLKNSSTRLKDLTELTEEGHSLGLVFYAISYTFLAWFFASEPYIIAAAILPMAYGDSAAAIIGEKFGKRKYHLVSGKSLEGSIVMFFASLLSFTLSLLFFSTLYSFSIYEKIIPAIAVAAVATLIESLSPKGFDNLTVPAFCVLTFLLTTGGI